MCVPGRLCSISLVSGLWCFCRTWTFMWLCFMCSVQVYSSGPWVLMNWGPQLTTVLLLFFCHSWSEHVWLHGEHSQLHRNCHSHLYWSVWWPHARRAQCPCEQGRYRGLLTVVEAYSHHTLGLALIKILPGCHLVIFFLLKEKESHAFFLCLSPPSRMPLSVSIWLIASRS